jgi:hypothetical protein
VAQRDRIPFTGIYHGHRTLQLVKGKIEHVYGASTGLATSRGPDDEPCDSIRRRVCRCPHPCEVKHDDAITGTGRMNTPNGHRGADTRREIPAS